MSIYTSWSNVAVTFFTFNITTCPKFQSISPTSFTFQTDEKKKKGKFRANKQTKKKIQFQTPITKSQPKGKWEKKTNLWNDFWQKTLLSGIGEMLLIEIKAWESTTQDKKKSRAQQSKGLVDAISKGKCYQKRRRVAARKHGGRHGNLQSEWLQKYTMFEWTRKLFWYPT